MSHTTKETIMMCGRMEKGDGVHEYPRLEWIIPQSLTSAPSHVYEGAHKKEEGTLFHCA